MFVKATIKSPIKFGEYFCKGIGDIKRVLLYSPQRNEWYYNEYIDPANSRETEKIIVHPAEIRWLDEEAINERLEFLNCLEEAGVDNWDGYSLACQLRYREYK